MSDDQRVRKKRRKLRGYHVLILALLVGIGWFGLYRWRLKSQLQSRLDAIRAAGYPVTIAELDDWYSIPQDVENAAYVILDAVSYYQGPNMPKLIPVVGQAKLPTRMEALSDDAKKLVEVFLAKNKQTLEILREAIGIEHSRYPIDLGNRNLALLHLSHTRRMAGLLKLEAFLHSENNEAKSAVEAVESIFAVAGSLSDDPLLISQLVRLGQLRLGVSAIERVVNRCVFTDSQLVDLSEAILRSVESAGLARGLASERSIMFDIYTKPGNWNLEALGDDIPAFAVLELYQAIGLFDRAAIIYLDRIDAYIEIGELPEHERFEAAKAIDDKVEAISGIPEFFKQFVSLHPRSTGSELATTAQMRVGRVGLAIERHRLAASGLPDALGELVPIFLDAVPKDPFDGAELRYKKLGKGYAVYSIGEDGSDDGGRERLAREERKDPEENWDVTFIVER